MKRLLLILLILLTTMSVDLYCQKVTYVVFNSTSSEEGIIRKESINTDFKDEPNYLFMINSKKNDYWFAYGHRKDKDFNPEILIRPLIFLNSISCIDWDSKKSNLSKTEVEELIKDINDSDKIYFIDRRDFKGTSIKLIQVRSLHSIY